MIKIESYNGIAPRYAPHNLPPTAAQVAENCKFTSGSLKPFYEATTVWTPTKVGTKKTIFLYQDTYWFHWLEDVNAVNSPIAADPYARVYWTGENEPRMTGSDIATSGGGTDYPSNHWILGVPAPASAITHSYGGASDPDNVQSVAWIYTYVTGYGEEGPPSDPSELLDITDGDTVNLTIPGTGPTGNYNVTHKKIYRLNKGPSGTIYQYVATIAAATTAYADSIASASLGLEIETTEYDPPNAAMKGLISLPNGGMAGFFDNVLALCVPYKPHAWPVRYRLSFFDDVVHIGAFGTSILVTTKGDKPYVVTGTDPAYMSQELLEVGYANMSKRGAVDMGTAIIYPSPVGFIIGGTGTIGVLTENIITGDEWDQFYPATMESYKYRENLISFYGLAGSRKALVFNVKSGDLSTLNIDASAGYTDPGTGDLYCQVGDDIVKLDASATPMTMVWESKDFPTRPVNYGAAMVKAGAYPVTLKIYADGVLKHTQTVASELPFSLPGGFLATLWKVRVEGTKEVKPVYLARTKRELIAV